MASLLTTDQQTSRAVLVHRQVTPPWLQCNGDLSSFQDGDENKKTFRPELAIPPALFFSRERRVLVGLRDLDLKLLEEEGGREVAWLVTIFST